MSNKDSVRTKIAEVLINLMEILAITQVFEKRVVGQYSLHAKSPECVFDVVGPVVCFHFP